MYKEATRLKLRFQTSKGSLSVEQMWDLPLTELDKLAVQLEEDYNNSKGKSFLVKRTSKDKSIKLQFDIVLDILMSKSSEQDAVQQAKEVREHNQKILSLITRKQEADLEDKSVEELKSLLK